MNKFIAAMLFVSACAASAFTNEVQAQDAQNLPIGQSAHKKQIDRLEILQTELQQSQQAHQQAIQQQPQNPELIHRHEQDINALNREIERANKEKVIDVTWKQTPQKSTNSQQQATKADQEQKHYEPWDVFNNFGKKETKQ